MSDSCKCVEIGIYIFSTLYIDRTHSQTAGNFIEELQPSDFPKVMRNMFGFLTLLNSPITLVATALVPIDELRNNSAIAVSILGQYAVGGHRWLRIWIMVDAIIVLCAGVLTGLIAATGLMERMARQVHANI
jgi:amino acid transporter